MRSLLSHISFKGSLFWRYFSLLSVVVCIFLFALTTFINYSSKVLQSSYFEQTQENFYQNSETFSNDLNLIHSLISTVRSSDNFILISLAEQPVTLQQRFHFNKVQSSFKQQCSLLSQIEDGFIYFEHSSACVTTQNYYPDSEDCFRAFYSHEDPLFLEDLVKNIDSRHKLCTIPTRMLSINGTAPASYLLTLMKPQSSSQIFGFFYPEETILNSFQIDALPEDTCFKLISNTGEVLLSYNEDKTTQSDYIEFTAPIPSLSGTAVLGIPQSYFDALTNESQAFAQKTLLSSVFIGMLLCILFSYIGVKPFQFLIHEHALSQPESGNEVTAIDSFLKNTKQNNEVLRNMLLSSALTRAFYALPMNENEYARLASDFPIFQKQD